MLDIVFFAVLIIFINLAFCFRPTPIIAIPISLFTFYITAMVFIKDDTIPAQPYFSFFVLLVAVASIFVNAYSTKEK